jgi:hypothetical protein
MTTIALTPEAQAFLARVSAELADLPPDERDELLEDIESHLAEVTGEGSAPLALRLGTAEEFAQELRNSAGLPARSERAPTSRLVAVRTWIDRGVRRAESLRSLIDGALLWLIARGWLLAVAAAVVIGGLGGTRSWSLEHAWLPHAGLTGYGAIVALATFVAVSLWLGRRAVTKRALRLDRFASALAIAAVLPVAWHLEHLGPRDHYVPYPAYSAQPTGLYLDGVPVTNIFPYDRAGKPLNDVMLFQQDGAPLRIGASGVDDPNRRYLVTRRSQRLYNSFPMRYFDPGTTRVAHPDAGPRVQVPDILTPALKGASP